MRARAALLIAALALLAGCSRREHANPFDPANPSTGGRPAGFMALAENTFVRLRWASSNASGLVGFQLQRRAAGQAAFTPLGSTFPPGSAGFVDLGLANGTLYEYRLYHVFAAGVGGLPAEDHATPGRARAWATDFDAGALLRFTADGRYVAESVTGFGSPAEVTVDPGSGVVWCTDDGTGSVVAVAPGAPVPLRVDGFRRPGALAVDPLDHAVWVCDEAASQLRHLRPNGLPATPSSIGSLDEPLGVAVDPADRSVWVCERAGNAVRRFSADGVQLGLAAVMLPSRLAMDSLTRVVWVSSFSLGQVVRLSSSLTPLDTLRGFVGPVGIGIDHRRGRIWVADPGAGAVVALDRSGTVQFRVTGLPGARAVAVDLASGEAWAVVSGAGRVVRISPAGAVLESVSGLALPWSIALDGSGP